MLPGNLPLHAYMLATAPLRWWLRKRLGRHSQSPVTGLFLHRIADEYPNPWSMTTSQFDALLDWLLQHVDLVTIDEAQRRVQYGHRGRPSVHLSFDDGYADNCLHAIPELLTQKIPFTYYVTTHNIRYGKPFPHDLKRGEPLAPNSIDEIRAMSDAGVEIGAHTRTHPDLGPFSQYRDIDFEIRGSRDDLANWTGREPEHFAFPFGQVENLNPRVIQYLYDERYRSYCSAYGGYNFPFDSNPFHLKRFHGDPILPRVQNWLSCDPRWIYAPSKFNYEPIVREPAASHQRATTKSP